MFSRRSLAMSDKELQRWERIRARGEVFFVFIRGVLVYGGFMFISNTGSAILMFHRQLGFATVALNAVTFLMAGFVFGVLLWYLQESRSRKTKHESANHADTPEFRVDHDTER